MVITKKLNIEQKTTLYNFLKKLKTYLPITTIMKFQNNEKFSFYDYKYIMKGIEYYEKLEYSSLQEFKLNKQENKVILIVFWNYKAYLNKHIEFLHLVE
jgi:molybdenum cofactor biosynthesis enzyme MoaA